MSSISINKSLLKDSLKETLLGEFDTTNQYLQTGRRLEETIKHKACKLGGFQKPERRAISNPKFTGTNGYAGPAAKIVQKTMRQREKSSAHRNDIKPSITRRYADLRPNRSQNTRANRALPFL